jgi:hypothetical protein
MSTKELYPGDLLITILNNDIGISLILEYMVITTNEVSRQQSSSKDKTQKLYFNIKEQNIKIFELRNSNATMFLINALGKILSIT